MAWLVLLFAILFRLVPHLSHGTAVNVSLLGTGLIYFGARLRGPRLLLLAALPLLAAMDWALTTQVYGYRFHIAGYLLTWVWAVGVAALARQVLPRPMAQPATSAAAWRVAMLAVVAPFSFFLLSNGEVWAASGMYPHNSAGLLACYAAGVPFFRNDLISTVVGCAFVFGLPVLARRLAEVAAPSSTPGSAA